MNMQRRKRYFIEPNVQGGLVLRVLLYWFATVVLIGGIACLVALAMSDVISADVIFTRLIESFGPSIIASVVVLPVLILDAIRYSHRSVGPVVRIQNELHRLASGQTPEKVKFRKKDHWKQLGVEFNKILDEMIRLRESQAYQSQGDSSNEQMQSAKISD